MGRWARSRTPAPQATLLNIALALAAVVYAIGSACDTGLQQCLDLYERAQSDIDQPDLDGQFSGLSDLQKKCMSLRTLHMCISNMSRGHHGCAGNLYYHSFKKGVGNQMKQFNCSENGKVYIPPPGNIKPPPKPSYRCSYHGPKVYKLCQLFGDPHLRTFDDRLQTCRLEGAWPLVDNDYLIVQVTNDAVGAAASDDVRPTATTKVTVMIKRDGEGCATNELFVTLQASSDSLPGRFDDGSTTLGPEQSVSLIEQDPGKHVEIYLSYIDTTIILRKNGRFLSTSIRMPEEVTNSTSSYSHSHRHTRHKLQLCTKGCPKTELINYKKILLQKHGRLKSSTDVVRKKSTSVAMTVDIALSICRRANLVDLYLDSCVFDLMATANVNFTQDATMAFSDMLKLYPNGAWLLRNRTNLPLADSAQCHRTRPSCILCIALGVLLYLTQWSSNFVL